ncbi:MAG TPA: hypothetical protein VKS81_04245, partial [Bacteroidota bacterium]|nr:hypothetical protein [Bacteroidota bacterium]
MEYPSYKYPVESLKTGASFGNRYAFARLDEQSNLRGLWSSTDNQYYLGEWDIDFFLDGTQLQPETTIFYPESQVTVYSGGGLTVERQFLLPFREYHVSIDDAPELRSACVQIRIRNSLRVSAELVVRHQLYFPANVSEKFTK